MYFCSILLNDCFKYKYSIVPPASYSQIVKQVCFLVVEIMFIETKCKVKKKSRMRMWN